MKYIFLLFIVFLLINPIWAITVPGTKDNIPWETWSGEVFKKAGKENRLVILDLEAVWCHWCHVMHETTYKDPAISQLIKSKFIPLRVDQDSRPDLSNRYREYGWPATIIFNAKGEELIKRAGYIPPDEMKLELERILANPAPEEPHIDFAKIKYSPNAYLSNELKRELIEMHKSSFDTKLGGFKSFQKYLDRDAAEYSLICAKNKDQSEVQRVQKTLDASLMLIDPVWGGVYQYSTMGTWDYPHFEKLATLQGEYIRIYSKAYDTLQNKNYLKAAENIHRYIKRFLTSPDGVFYVSQDADLVQGQHSYDYFALDDFARRKQGIPRIDKHIYSSQNGLIINGLISLYNSTHDEKYLQDAITATNWIIKHRTFRGSISQTISWIFSDLVSTESILESIKWILVNKTWPERGFRHGEVDVAGPYLSDTLYMGQTFLNLYIATSDKKWLTFSEQTARFIKRNFEAPIAGFSTSKASCEVCAVHRPDSLVDENIVLARFANRLFGYTKEHDYRNIAEHAMRFLSTQEIATRTITEPGILIANLELNPGN